MVNYRVEITIKRNDGVTLDRRFIYRDADEVQQVGWNGEIADMIDSLDNLDDV